MIKGNRRSWIISAVLLVYMITGIGCSATNDKLKQAISQEETKLPIVIEETKSIESNPKEKLAIAKNENQENHYNKYVANLYVDPQDRTIHGAQKVTYKNQTGKPQHNIYFHLYLNAFKKDSAKPFFKEAEKRVYCRGFDEGFIDIQSVVVNNREISYTIKDTILCVEFEEALKPDDQVEIGMQFDSYIPQIAHRIGANQHAMWAGNYLPIVAVYDHRGWNLDPYYPAGDPFYSEIANYEISVSTPKEYTVVGTGLETETVSEDIKTTVIHAKMVREFAFAVSKNFIESSIDIDDMVTVRLYHYTPDLVYAQKILEWAKKSIEYYSERVGTYPYQELDIVETELFLSGGMEYPQFIMMDTQQLKNYRVNETIAHEIGHQWFYNIVGSNQIQEPWLDEGVTSYIQQGLFYSPAELDILMEGERIQMKKQLDLAGQPTLRTPLWEYTSRSSYYWVNYKKGKLMMHALYCKMGVDLFDEFIKKYYKTYAFKIATGQNFMETAEEVYGESLHSFFKEWIYEKEIPSF